MEKTDKIMKNFQILIFIPKEAHCIGKKTQNNIMISRG